jgi:hypothetical protein
MTFTHCLQGENWATHMRKKSLSDIGPRYPKLTATENRKINKVNPSTD